jgi:hypothetical protein
MSFTNLIINVLIQVINKIIGQSWVDYNPTTQEAKQEDQEFKASYIARPCFTKKYDQTVWELPSRPMKIH